MSRFQASKSSMRTSLRLDVSALMRLEEAGSWASQRRSASTRPPLMNTAIMVPITTPSRRCHPKWVPVGTYG